MAHGVQDDALGGVAGLLNINLCCRITEVIHDYNLCVMMEVWMLMFLTLGC